MISYKIIKSFFFRFKNRVQKLVLVSHSYIVEIKDSISYDTCSKLWCISLKQSYIEKMFTDYSSEISEIKKEILRERLTNNADEKTYLIIDDDENIYGYYHIAFGESFDRTINTIIPQCNDSIYLFDDYTFKKWRGKGAHLCSIASRLNIGHELNKKYATVNIIKGNVPSEKAYTKLGFRKAKTNYCIKIGKYTKTIVKEHKYDY